ncbi:DUF3833 domain-containing protein [Elioraea sp.]|uniref:DUF3833 domain-containing protein n=1 Tax=Elioraea sp. TaxID=2185103 RepID=UPI00307E0301
MRRIVAALAAVLALAGCGSGMRIEDFAGRTPELRLEEYFAGRTRAWGLFEDRFGTVRRTFTVDITGTWDGTTLTLDEDFLYDDGETQKRIWRLTRTGERQWEGRAADVIGVATGREAGNAFRFGYRLNLKVGDSTWEVRFDDWMFRIDDEVVLNTAKVYRWGIWIGTVQLAFRRVSAS